MPDALRGRVMSVYTTVFAGSTPVRRPVLWLPGGGYGIQVALAAGGVIALLTVIGAWIWLRQRVPAEAMA